MAGIYIHIPFCAAKCRYCDFISFADHSNWERYFAALISEMDLWSKEAAGITFDTVFIGGGTPSIVPPKVMERIMSQLTSCFAIAPDAEITIESNPGTLTREKLEAYKNAGINRISIGLQSSDDIVLENIGRIHNYEQFVKSFELARECGFSNINVDIMYGLPEQTVEIHLDTIKRIAALGADHISAYSLILEESTPLYMDVNGGGQSLPDEDTAYDMHIDGIKLLSELGYERYEVSNYAKPGFRSKHNLNYWNNGEYLGLGLNSHSAMRINGEWKRWSNKAELESYIDDCALGKLPIAGQMEIIDEAEEMFETLMLGLRKTDGVSFSEFKARFGKALTDVFASAIQKLIDCGWIEIADGHLKLTANGMDLQNMALLEFME